MTNITAKVFKLVEQEDTEIAKRVYKNVLGRDCMNVIEDNGNVWIEQITTVPDYAFLYVLSLLKRQGYNTN